MFHRIRTILAQSPYFASIRRLIVSFRTKRAQNLAFHQAYRELQLLTSRELAEFGLYRSDLYEMARATVYRA